MASIVSGERKSQNDAGAIFNSGIKKVKSPMNLPVINRSKQTFNSGFEIKHNSSLNIKNRKDEYNRIQVENMVS